MATFYSPSGNPEVWDSKPEGYLTVEEWQASQPPIPPLTPEQLETAFSAAVTARLNSFASERQYDTIQNAMLMLESAAFQADGLAAYSAYDITWQKAITLMPQVGSGLLSLDNALSQLPELAWPEG